MPAVIAAKRLTMHFRRCDALRGVDLDVRPGTVFALLGENGAGKTTLIRILTGFQKPSSGTCSVVGIDPVADPLGVRQNIGYVSDSPALYDWMTVAQIGGFAGSFYDQAFLARFEESIVRYEIRPDQKIKHLSKGQRAKVALSLALSHDPQLLILDEPTSGLDPKVRRSFLESMIDRAATGRTVLLSSHQINEVERVADSIAILHRGKIVLTGPLADIRQSIWHVIIDVDDPLRALPIIPEPARTISEEVGGAQRQCFVQNLSTELIDNLRNQDGVIDVRCRLASLEEVFLACTSGGFDSEDQSVGIRPSQERLVAPESEVVS